MTYNTRKHKKAWLSFRKKQIKHAKSSTRKLRKDIKLNKSIGDTQKLYESEYEYQSI